MMARRTLGSLFASKPTYCASTSVTAGEHARLDLAKTGEHRGRDRECLAVPTLSRATLAPDDFDLHERQIMI